MPDRPEKKTTPENGVDEDKRGNRMNILILGAAGFIGTNLTIKLAENKDNLCPC